MNKRHRRFNRKTKHVTPGQAELKLYYPQPDWMTRWLDKLAANDNNPGTEKSGTPENLTEEPG